MSRFAFAKPAGMRYVDMCKEFDDTFYTPERDDDKLFSYMFLLFKMFACKGNYFSNKEDYDQYAMFAATVLYMRYLSKLRKGERIVSLLNYVKAVKGPLKVTYQNENFAQVFDPDSDNRTADGGLREWHRGVIAGADDPAMRSEVADALADMPRLLSEAVSESPFASDPTVAKDLLVSCMLTLVGMLTPPEGSPGSPDDSKEMRRLRDAMREPPVLWKLPQSMAPEVEGAINKARSRASEGINEIRGRYSIPDDVMEDIVSSAYAESCLQIEQEDD